MAGVKVSRRLDAIDQERFGDMVASPSFALLTARISAELDRARVDCENECDLALTRAQGRVKAYRTVLGLPEAILAEMYERKNN